MKKLPIGIQTFELLVKGNCLYVDKTKHIFQLAQPEERYFLSRPRRFGKSLLISTLKALFENKRELFKNLWIDSSDYSWEAYPVVHIDFSALSSASENTLKDDLIGRLGDVARDYKLLLDKETSPERALTTLINELYSSTGKRVVVLIDEYDAPLLAHITNPTLRDPIHTLLKGFYTTLKSLDASLHFIFITGVSKFSKTSIFSGFNNLKDLTLDERFADLLGYTEHELGASFADWIKTTADALALPIDQLRNNLRFWYDGYRFSSAVMQVYNPFSVLNFFDRKKFLSFWFTSGTPTFLFKQIAKGDYALQDIETVRMGEFDFEAVEVDRLKLEPLLFQTGYLTISDYDAESEVYTLAYPNEEVRRTFRFAFVDYFAHMNSQKLQDYARALMLALKNGNSDQFIKLLRIFFAGIPYTVQLALEKYYQSMFFVLLKLLGADVQVEVATNNGRIDAVVKTSRYLYIIECKIDAPAQEALEQIYAKKYYEAYQAENRQIVLIGLTFDTKKRELDYKIAGPDNSSTSV